MRLCSLCGEGVGCCDRQSAGGTSTMQMQATLRMCLTAKKRWPNVQTSFLAESGQNLFLDLLIFCPWRPLWGSGCCHSRRDSIDWVEYILNQGVPWKSMCSLISLFTCPFCLFKFKFILEALIWGSVLGIMGKYPFTVEQQKWFWTTSVDTPYSVSLKPGFLCLVSQGLKWATGKVKVSLTHGTYIVMSWTVSCPSNSYVEVLTLNVS